MASRPITEELTANATQVSKSVECVNKLTQATASAVQIPLPCEQLSGMAQDLDVQLFSP